MADKVWRHLHQLSLKCVMDKNARHIIRVHRYNIVTMHNVDHKIIQCKATILYVHQQTEKYFQIMPETVKEMHQISKTVG